MDFKLGLSHGQLFNVKDKNHSQENVTVLI
jgi:hypothetical protein